MKLAARQKVLLSRLIALGELARDRKLSVEVIEILGFGSFFRGKPAPKDVDLIIRCTKEPCRAFSAFGTILEHVCREAQYQRDYDRPLAAFLHEYDRRHTNMLPGLVSLAEERALFSDWLEPYSWSMLFPKSVAEGYGWEDPAGFARRFLRRALPNLNVIYYIFPGVTPEQIGLRAGFTESIWSRERPDIQANVFAALSPERAAANSRKELRSFHLQLFRLRATEQFLKPHARPKADRGAHDFHLNDHYSLLEDGILLTEEEAIEHLGHSHEFPYDGISSDEVTATVEMLRADVKDLWPRVEAIRKIIRLLNWHSQGDRGDSNSAEEFAIEELLSTGAAKQRDFLKTLLVELGYAC